MRIDSSGKILGSQGTNWVGTVAESATSSVIEQGSNANGIFTKFADGTMICTNNNLSIVGVGSTFPNLIWSFPIAFISTPTVSFTPRLNTGNWSVPGDRSDIIESGLTALNTNSVTLTIYMSVAKTVTVTENHATAIGRWY